MDEIVWASEDEKADRFIEELDAEWEAAWEIWFEMEAEEDN